MKTKHKIQIAIASWLFVACALFLTGCYTPQGQPVNISPLAALNSLASTNSGWNPGTMNPRAVTLACTQLRQFGYVKVIGPNGTIVDFERNMPPGYVDQPVTPLLPDEETLVNGDILGGAIYGLRNDHSNINLTLNPFPGWTILIAMAYPPSSLNTTTATTITPPSTNMVPVITPATTNTVNILTPSK
jgi:hypothetical protein